MNRVEIYDIDGCICESFFPNLNEKVDPNQLKEMVLNTPLNLDFIQYHSNISKIRGIKTYFITGRRSKDFQQETFFQLKELNISPEQIIFFPDNYSHTKIRYNIFKIYSILKLAIQHKNSDIFVYDDLDGYYSKLLSLSKRLEIPKLYLNTVKDFNQFWKEKRGVD